MGSKMLADLRPEIKSEETQLAEDEINKLAQQLQALHKAAKSTSAPVRPSTTNKAAEVPPEEPLINFGWTTLENEPALPFILRDSKSYVADKIYEGRLASRISKVFSTKFFECFTLKGELMTNREADVFNEINVKHCDRSLVGDYNFKAGEYMTYLDDIKQLIKFFEACHNVVWFNKLDNDMFGFLKIAGESEVPFVWSEGRRLLPLFYFDGESDYLSSKAVDLADKWKRAYLRFCCVSQNIRKDHYAQVPLKVVDFEYLKELFPKNTKFELCWPKDANQELLAPEIRVAKLHGMPVTGGPTANQQTAYESSWLHPSAPAPKGNQTRVASKRPGGKDKPTTAKRPRNDNSVGVNHLEGLGAALAPRQAIAYSNTSSSQITNVPQTSPLTASSPELRLASPMITEAVTTVDYNCEANSLYSPVPIGISSNLQQQEKEWKQRQQQRPNSRPIQYSRTHPHSARFQNFSPNRQVVHQPGIASSLSESIRTFLLKYLRSIGGRDVESKIMELAWSYMLEQNIALEMQLGQLVVKEMHRLWKEMKPHFRSSPSQQLSSPSPVQNINITNVTNVIQASKNSQYPTSNYYISSNTPNNIGINTSSTSISITTNPPENNWKARIEVPEHLYFLWPEKESYPYVIRECPIKKDNILGISLSPIVNEFLVNLSDIRRLRPGSSKFSPSNFKKIYALNQVQLAQWRKLLDSGRTQAVGRYKDVFVSYKEVLEMC